MQIAGNSLSIGQAGQLGGPGRPPGPPGGPIKAAMDGAAEALGMEPTELKQRLEAGDTLGSIAEETGTSTEELKAAMVAAVAEVSPADVVDRVTADLDKIIAGERPQGPHRPPPGSVDPSKAIERLAESLDLTSEDLFAAIEDGTFADLLKTEGVNDSRGLLVDTES